MGKNQKKIIASVIGISILGTGLYFANNVNFEKNLIRLEAIKEARKSNITINEDRKEIVLVDNYNIYTIESDSDILLEHPRLEKMDGKNKYKLKNIENTTPFAFDTVINEVTYRVKVYPQNPIIKINYKKNGELIKTEEETYRPNAVNGIQKGTEFTHNARTYTISNTDNLPERITEYGEYDVEVTEENKTVVEIKDRILKERIIEILKEGNPNNVKDGYKKLPSESEVYEDELDKIISLDLRAAEPEKKGNVIDLTGIEKLINLENLLVEEYNLVNIENVKQLKKLRVLGITSLNMSKTYYSGILKRENETGTLKVLDYNKFSIPNLIETVGKINTLEQVVLVGLDIENIGEIASLPNLRQLTLSFNNIKDVEQFKDLVNRIEYLDLIGNKVENVDALRKILPKDIQPLRLDISMNNIKNATELYGYTTNQFIDVNAEDGIFSLELLNTNGEKIEIVNDKVEKTSKENEYRILSEDNEIIVGVGDKDTTNMGLSWRLRITNTKTKTNVTINYKNNSGELIKTETKEVKIGETVTINDEFEHNNKRYIVKNKASLPERVSENGGTFDVTVAETLNAGVITDMIPSAPVKIKALEIEKGRLLSIDDIKNVIEGIDETNTVEEVNGSVINFDAETPGEYVVKVKILNPNGSSRIVEVPVKVILKNIESINVEGEIKIDGKVEDNLKVIVKLYEDGKETSKTSEISKDNPRYEFKNLPKTDKYGNVKVYTVKIENEETLKEKGYKVEVEKNGNIKIIGKKEKDNFATRILPKAGGEQKSAILAILAFTVAPILYFGRKLKTVSKGKH